MKCETRELALLGIRDDILLTRRLLSVDFRQLKKVSECCSGPHLMRPWAAGEVGGNTVVKTFALVFRSQLTNQK